MACNGCEVQVNPLGTAGIATEAFRENDFHMGRGASGGTSKLHAETLRWKVRNHDSVPGRPRVVVEREAVRVEGGTEDSLETFF